jgi:hypothetical protein
MKSVSFLTLPDSGYSESSLSSRREGEEGEFVVKISIIL